MDNVHTAEPAPVAPLPEGSPAAPKSTPSTGGLFPTLFPGATPIPSSTIEQVGVPTVTATPPVTLTPAVMITPTPTLTPTPTGTPTLTPTPTLTTTPTVTPLPELTVAIALETAATEVREGEEFDVIVQVSAGVTNRVDTVQVYLDFDATKLEAISLASGGRLEYQLQSLLDNSGGRVAYAAGTLGDARELPFTLGTLTFRAKADSGGREVSIQFAPLRAPRQTKAINRGLNVTGQLIPVGVIVR